MFEINAAETQAYNSVVKLRGNGEDGNGRGREGEREEKEGVRKKERGGGERGREGKAFPLL